MPSSRYATIRIELVWLDPGLWCDSCCLPSGFLAHCVLHLGTSRAHSMADIEWCENCGPMQQIDASTLGF